MTKALPIFLDQNIIPGIITVAILGDQVLYRLFQKRTIFRYLTALITLTLIGLVQMMIFFHMKSPNIYDLLGRKRLNPSQANRNYPMDMETQSQLEDFQRLLTNPERLFFYEKYHQIDTDLHFLRSPGFQNEVIIEAFNFYLVLLMIAISSTQDKQAQHSRNYMITTIFAFYVFEAQLLLSPEFRPYEKGRLTTKEQVLLVKTLLLTFLYQIKYFVCYFATPMHDRVGVSIAKTLQIYQSHMKREEDLDSEILEQLKTIQKKVISINTGSEESVDGYFSNHQVYNALYLMTLYLLYTGKYEY